MNAILSFSLLGWRTGAQNFQLSNGSSVVGMKSSFLGGRNLVEKDRNTWTLIDEFMVFRLYLLNEMPKNLIKKGHMYYF